MEFLKMTLEKFARLPQGSVATGRFARDRAGLWVAHIQELKDPLDSANLSQGLKKDWYDSAEILNPDGSVSVEGARDREMEIKNALDDAVEDENRYSSEPGRVAGDVDAPCRVLKRRNWS